MSSKGKKRKRSASPDVLASEAPRVQKLRIKPIPEMPAEEASMSGRKHSKKQKHHVSPISSTSISPPGDGGEDGGLKMKFILSPKRVKVESSPARSETPDDASPSRGSVKGKKKDRLKAKLFFEDQVLTLDGETVTHQETHKSGKKGKSSPRSSEIKQSPSSKKKKKDTEKGKVREEPIPPFTKVPKSAERAKMKVVKTESDSGYSDTPTTSAKGKKAKAKMIIQQTIEEQPAPSPQASDVSRDSLPKKSKKKDKDKKKKKMFKFKGDRNRFLNVRDFSDEETGDNSLSRSLMDEDSLGGTFDATDDLSKDMDFMMPQMPVPDYNLEKQAADDYTQSMKARSGLDDGKESEIQSGRAEDLISQLTAYGTEMETIYPSYMLAPDMKEESCSDDGWREKKWKKKKKRKFGKDKKKKKKELRVLERDEHGNAKYVMRKTKISGYMLWCRSYRPTFVSQNPGLDFSTISRRMGALWQTLDESEKKVWRKREITVNTKVPITRLTKGGKVVPAELSNDVPPFRLQPKPSEKHKSKKSKKLAAAAAVAAKKKQMVKKKANVKITPPRWEPIDCAAYLRLLGSSLSDVGGKLQNKFSTSLQNDDIEVHGSMSVLLDSMLCAMGPLLCLTDQVPEISSITKKSKSTMLDNIAYIMPGL